MEEGALPLGPHFKKLYRRRHLVGQLGWVDFVKIFYLADRVILLAAFITIFANFPSRNRQRV